MSLQEALLKWLSLANNHDSNLSALQVSDGIAMSQVLHKIDPKHFTEEWMSKLKTDISDNKRLKANNLRKLLNSVTDYTNDVIGLQLLDFPMPDTNRAAEGNIQDVGRIIQLILGCAVNCDHKQEYIENIMGMDSSTQQLIMQAIQEILNLPPVSDPSLPLLSASEIRHIMEDLEDAKAEKDQLMQKCHDLEMKVNLLQDEKSNLSAEYELLQKELAGKGDVASMKYDRNSDPRQKEMLKMLESAQEVEKERDELQLKVELLERQVEEFSSRETELQKIADQARALKDEVDILRDASEKVIKYEATIDSYKKKMEELSSLKRQLKLLEDNNTSLLQANLALENDVKKTGNWKPQVDVFKKQISEYHAKLETETKRADKLEFETKKLLEQLEAVKVERDRLQAERDELRETNSELADQIKIGNNSRLGSSKLEDEDDDFGLMAMIPLEVKEKLFRLKIENKKLKEQIGQEASGGQNEVLQTIVEELTEREARLESSNRKLNQKILELESKLEEAKGAQNIVAPRVPGSREELELKLAEANKKVAQLQDNIHKKETEMQAMEERYKKYIEKAKSVIKTLDPKQNPNAVPEVSALRKQLTEKDVLIEALEQENEKARAVREMEERLISSAFYNLSMQMHRATVENRLANVHSASPQQQGQSFLARQRQVGRNHPAASSNAVKNEFLDY